MRRVNCILCGLAVLTIVTFRTSPSLAGVVTSAGTVSGYWHSATTWSNGVPSNSGTTYYDAQWSGGSKFYASKVTYTSSDNYTVSAAEMLGSASTAELYFSGGTLNVAASGTGANGWFLLAWDNNARYGKLTMDGGVLNVAGASGLSCGGSANTSVGTNGTSIATINTGATWNANGGLWIGTVNVSTSGEATLNLFGGTLNTTAVTFNTNAYKASINFGNGGLLNFTTTGSMNTYGSITTTGAAGGVLSTASGVTETISTVISGSGAMTFGGSGKTILAGVNTYSGATTVTGGTLALAAAGSIANSASLVFGGSSAAAAVFDVSAKADNYSLSALSGIGTVALASGKALTLSSAINHTGVDSLTISGNLTLASGVTNTYEINLATDAHDYTNVSGTLNYNNTSLAISFSGAKTANGTYQFDILDFVGSALGATTSVSFAGLDAASETASYDASSGVVTLTVVPEPGALALLAGALLGLIAFAWRKRKNCG
jgi:fibronectin-binding autotransporter adhesin